MMHHLRRSLFRVPRQKKAPGARPGAGRQRSLELILFVGLALRLGRSALLAGLVAGLDGYGL